MIVLSLDQSSVSTGYSVFDGSDLLRYGVIDLHKCDTNERIPNMCRRINALLDKVHPDIVIFEDVSLRTSVKTLIMLSRLQGCIMQSCYERNIPFHVYAATSWRKLIGMKQGSKKRKELKEDAMSLVRSSYGINIGDDCAESICMGLAYLKENDMLPDLEQLRKNKRQPIIKKEK